MGFTTRAATWESDASLSLGLSTFFLTVSNESNGIGQLHLKGLSEHPSQQGISGCPVWQFGRNKDSVIPRLVGVVKGGDDQYITLHGLKDLKSDGSWRYV
jgi:hypothetical protein